jgi:hypothetical protein
MYLFWVQVANVTLVLGTALTHIPLFFPDIPFILNGLGYLALGVALYLTLVPKIVDRRTVRWVLIAYTTLTIMLWVLIGGRMLVGYLNKLNELLLIIGLVMEDTLWAD